MSTIISFPQIFSLTKGVNYLYNKANKPINYKTLLSPNGFTFNPVPLTNYVQGIHSDSTIYTTSNSTNVFDSKLIFKYGGNLGKKDKLTYYPVIKDKRDTAFPIRPRIFAGDMLLMLASNAVDGGIPSTYKLDGKNLVLTSELGFHNRGCLTASFTNNVGNINQYTYTPPLLGEFILVDQVNGLDITIYFKGFVNPLEGNPVNSYGDYRIGVGLGRDHREGNFLNYNPGNGPTVRLNGALYGFMPFFTNGSYTWWAIIHTVNLDTPAATVVWFSQNTNLNAHISQELKVNISNNGIITWYANGNQIAQQNITSYANASLDEIIVPYVFFREMKSTQANPTNVPPNKQSITIEEFIVYPKQYKEYPFTFSSTLNTLDNNELYYHNTGIQLLKKLK